jgi:hypothetical protein
MKAFHGSEEVKEKYVERMKAHIAADELTTGTGWRNGSGCAVGCTLNKYDHKAYEVELGLPEWLAHLEDVLFENVSEDYSRTFPLRFLEVIPIGVDVDRINNTFLHFVVSDAKRFVRAEFSGVHKAIDRVLELLLQSQVSNEEWHAAARAADAYDTDAAYAYAARAAYAAADAADAADAYDTDAAARAAYAAADAAYAAYADSYAADVARADACERYAEQLLTLLSSLKEEV